MENLFGIILWIIITTGFVLYLISTIGVTEGLASNKYFPLFINKLLFRTQLWWWASLVKRGKIGSSLFNYPILISMSLNKQLWWDKYQIGISIPDQMRTQAEKISINLAKTIKCVQYKSERREKMSDTERFALFTRYTQFKDYWETENEIRTTLKDVGITIKENEK